MADLSDIPAHIDDVEAVWLESILKSGRHLTQGSIASIEAERVGIGVGILADLAKISISYDEANPEAPSSVIVKLQSHVEANRALSMTFSFYERELLFYERIAPLVPGRTPKVYGTQHQPELERFALVIEDLSHLEMPDQVAGLEIEKANTVVDWMATLHAAFWNDIDTEALSFMPKGDDPITLMVADLYTQGWDPFLQIYGSELPEGGKELGEAVKDNFTWLLRALTDGPLTVAHTDFRLDNLFFDESGDVIPIDWQVSVRTAGIYDMAYFLGGSLTVHDRRANERELVQRYVDKLASLGVDNYDFDQAWRDYRLCHLVCTVVPVNGIMIDMGNERGVKLFKVLTKRHFTAALDLDSIALLAEMKEHS